ncbi:uncharacterized protein LOC114951290 [Acropora millepora]|uniref:uncharacterized protein LOC114951290 n=1 Tax=Acropora millepora TaxID=45264 RepID=UPI001CF1EBF0|nr:uncharacterized protein LOC114951290 [Acropora millepora]
MDRCIKPVDFGTVVSRQLHSFSDACSSGYGQVTYLRIENGKGDLHCSFLIGKARLAPVKPTTIPRLELTAATVSVQVGKMIRRELDVPIDSETFWTDSTTVLNYLRNKTRRFQVFVANRVQAIRDETVPTQWRFVNSKCNPADDASRGLKGCELSTQQCCIRGPDFLRLPALPPDLEEIPIDDPEVKEVHVHRIIVSKRSDVLMRFSRFPNWNKMKKCVARIFHLNSKSTERQLASKTSAKGARNESRVNLEPLRVE